MQGESRPVTISRMVDGTLLRGRYITPGFAGATGCLHAVPVGPLRGQAAWRWLRASDEGELNAPLDPEAPVTPGRTYTRVRRR
jgi:hypothetical protein